MLTSCLLADNRGDTWRELHALSINGIDSTKPARTELHKACGQVCHTPMVTCRLGKRMGSQYLSLLDSRRMAVPSSPSSGIDLPRCKSVCFQWSQKVGNVCVWAYKIGPQFAGHITGHELSAEVPVQS
jgi:hypothetical protein